MPKITGSGFAPRILSDHSPCWLTASLRSASPDRHWRLNPHWLSLLPDHDSITRELLFFFEKTQRPYALNTHWDDFKNHARRILSSRINRLKRESNTILQLTSDKLLDLEVAYNSNPSCENLNRVKLQTRLVTQLHIEKAKQRVFFVNREYTNRERGPGGCCRTWPTWTRSPHS